jgi:hypothetical protein
MHEIKLGLEILILLELKLEDNVFSLKSNNKD